MRLQTKCENEKNYCYYASRLIVMGPKKNQFYKFTLITNFTSFVTLFLSTAPSVVLVAGKAVSEGPEILGTSQ
jgi:hypothetical protein